jgi:hypothetical protein
MSDFLSPQILAELDAARRLKIRKQSRMRVLAGGQIYPILRLLPEGFTLDAETVGHLRGLVDIYDGGRHLSQCLIIASAIEAGELVCRMKWQASARVAPPLDYVRDETAPVGLLPRH